MCFELAFGDREWLRAFAVCFARGVIAGGKPLDVALACLISGLPPVVPPPVVPPPVEPPAMDEATATRSQVRIRFGSAGCTASVVDFKAGADRLLVTAYHCVRGQPQVGSYASPSGATGRVRVLGFHAGADVAVLAADGEIDLPRVRVAKTVPAVGASVWHRGFGVSVPGDRVAGRFAGGPDSAGMLRFTMRASPGDSGAGVFDASNQLVCVPVCCVSSDGSLFGGGPAAIHGVLSRFTTEILLYASSMEDFREVPPVSVYDMSERNEWSF